MYDHRRSVRRATVYLPGAAVAFRDRGGRDLYWVGQPFKANSQEQIAGVLGPDAASQIGTMMQHAGENPEQKRDRRYHVD